MDEYAYVVNVEGAVVRDGEYLLIRRAADEEHASGLLGFPGGKVEQPSGCENSIEETARRELAEEVGIEVGDVEYVTSKTFESDGGTRCLNVVTRCEHVAGEPTPEDPEEVAAVHWLSVEEIHDHPDAPPFLESYVEQIETVRDGAHSL
jgi:8-oxo-dGTP diphosphatase